MLRMSIRSFALVSASFLCVQSSWAVLLKDLEDGQKKIHVLIKNKNLAEIKSQVKNHGLLEKDSGIEFLIQSTEQNSSPASWQTLEKELFSSYEMAKLSFKKPTLFPTKPASPESIAEEEKEIKRRIDAQEESYSTTSVTSQKPTPSEKTLNPKTVTPLKKQPPKQQTTPQKVLAPDQIKKETPAQKVEAIPAVTKEAITAHRQKFAKWNMTSLPFTVSSQLIFLTNLPGAITHFGTTYRFDVYDPQKDNEYRFLSNYHKSGQPAIHPKDPILTYTINFNGVDFESVENVYQAAKMILGKENFDLKAFAKLTPDQARAQAQNVKLQGSDFKILDAIMYAAVRQKFINNPDMAKTLLATGNAPLYEGNNRGSKAKSDTRWGGYLDFAAQTFEGENKLGKILEHVRSEIQERLKDQVYDSFLKTSKGREAFVPNLILTNGVISFQ